MWGEDILSRDGADDVLGSSVDLELQDPECRRHLAGFLDCMADWGLHEPCRYAYFPVCWVS